MTLPRMADDFRRLLYEIEAEADRLTAAGDDVIRQIGYRIGDHVLPYRGPAVYCCIECTIADAT